MEKFKTKLKVCLLGLAMAALAINASAQKGTSQFSIIAGFEHFPELRVTKGYNLGIEFKHYVHNRFYVVANFHAGVNDGLEHVEYKNNDIDYKFDLGNSVRDYMIGFGMGADVMHIKRHKIYLQCTAGLGTTERNKDYISGSLGYDKVETQEEKATRFAISASAGYEYQLTSWLAVGANYTFYHIGYDQNSAANVKLGITF